MRLDNLWRRAFVGVLFAILAFAFVWAVGEASDVPAYSCRERSVLLGVGDTLDDVARSYCTGDVNAVIDALVREYGVQVQAWSRITLPPATP